MELKGKKIVFLGDSITQGAGASCPENSYLRRFGEMTGANCRNFGIGGTRIARKQTPSEIARYDLDFCGRFDNMDADADLIVVFGGTNDYGHGDAPLGEMDDRTVWSFYGACHVLYSGLIEKYPDKPIVILTPLHRVSELEKSPSLRQFVQAIREVAEFYSLPVLDLWATSGMQPLIPQQKELYFADLVHPNDAGHAQIAHKLKTFLENL